MESAKSHIHRLLRKMETYTKIDMVYFAKGGFWLNLNFLVSSVTSFALSIAFAHYVPKETYGTYQYILSIASILTALSLTGMNTAITQSVASGFEGSLKESIPVQFKWSIFPSFIALIISGYYFYNGAYIFALSFISVAFLLPVLNTMNTYNSYLTGKKEFKKFFTFNNAFNAGYLLAMLSVITLSHNPFYLILTYLGINSLMNTILYFKTLRVLPPNDKRDPGNLLYSKHLSFINILNVIAMKSDSILIFHYLGASDLAIYTFAKIIPDKIMGLFKSIMNIAMPKLTEKSHATIKASIHRQIIQLLFVGVTCSLLFIAIAPIFYKIFFPKYQSSVIFAQIYSLSMLSLAAYLPSMVLLSKKAIKEMYILNILNPFIQLTLIFFSLYYFGLIGVIVAKLLNQVLSLITYWTAANKKLSTAETNISPSPDLV